MERKHRQRDAAPKSRSSLLWWSRFLLPAFKAGISFVDTLGQIILKFLRKVHRFATGSTGDRKCFKVNTTRNTTRNATRNLLLLDTLSMGILAARFLRRRESGEKAARSSLTL